MISRLTTLIFLAMLTITPTSLRAQSAVFTTEQQNKLAKWMSEYGKKMTLDSNVTAAVGITKHGQSLTINELGYERSAIKHIYMILPNGGFLIGVDDTAAAAAAAYVYRLDANFKLIAAVKKVSGKQPVAIPAADAKRGIDVEINNWITEKLNKY
jgi:hypothetical protein